MISSDFFGEGFGRWLYGRLSAAFFSDSARKKQRFRRGEDLAISPGAGLKGCAHRGQEKTLPFMGMSFVLHVREQAGNPEQVGKPAPAVMEMDRFSVAMALFPLQVHVVIAMGRVPTLKFPVRSVTGVASLKRNVS